MTGSEYAALHLGIDRISLIRAPGATSQVARETVCATSVSVSEGHIVFGVDAGGHGGAHSPLTFVVDERMLVGDTAVPVQDMITGMLGRAVYGPHWQTLPDRVGLDMLEIACPTTWGARRRATVRSAAAPLAREVVLVDAAAAAVRCAGERVPPRLIVVESFPFATAIGVVFSTADGFRTQVVRSVDTGTADLAHGTDGVERLAAAVRDVTPFGVTDVFVIENEVGTAALVDALGRGDTDVRTVPGLDIARAMALRSGRSIDTVDAPPRVDYPRSDTSRFDTPARFDPLPTRSAAWLEDEIAAPRSARRRVPALAAGLIGVAVVAVAGLVVAIRTDAPVPNARPIADAAAPAVDAPKEAVPQSEPPPPDPPGRVTFGRVTVAVPASWQVTDAGNRLLLVPNELPERRIVVTTSELVAGSGIEDVAHDLEREISERTADSDAIPRFGQLEKAADFGGRVGLSYTETPDAESVVLWRVVVDEGLQVSVGCQSEPDATAVLERECTRAVSTVFVAPAA